MVGHNCITLPCIRAGYFFSNNSSQQFRAQLSAGSTYFGFDVVPGAHGSHDLGYSNVRFLFKSYSLLFLLGHVWLLSDAPVYKCTSVP